jgi:molybdopterin-guanine dinucleotide biosynthesis protein A
VAHRPQAPHCCAAILAGGRNTRMEGRNKAFLTIDGRTILDRLVDTLTPFFPEMLLVTRQPELYAGQGLRIVEDIFQARSSLTGIHAALWQARAAWVFVCPCDAPFIQPALIRLLLDSISPAVDAVVPRIGDYYEPLCAVYAKTCLDPITAQLEREEFQIKGFFRHIRIATIGEAQIRAVDPQLQSFLNVNTPEVYRALQVPKPRKEG